MKTTIHKSGIGIIGIGKTLNDAIHNANKLFENGKIYLDDNGLKTKGTDKNIYAIPITFFPDGLAEKELKFNAISELLRLNTKSTSYKIMVSHYLGGLKIGDAARKHGTSYNAAYQAVKRLKRGFLLAKAAAGTD